MKRKGAIIAAFLIVAGVLGAWNSIKNAMENRVEKPNQRPYTGMSFSTNNLVEEYELDDAYCLRYTDDNMTDAEILVDSVTYQNIMYCMRRDFELSGKLELCDYQDGIPVYELVDGKVNWKYRRNNSCE